MLILDAGYVGEVVKGDPFSIQVNTLTAAGALTAGFTGAGGVGVPTIRWREIDGATVGTTGITFVPNVPADGLHKITVDTSTLTKNLDYALEVAAGEVDGTTVDNHMLGIFTCSGKAAGRLYEQAVKCDSGTVTGSSGADRTFIITGPDIEDETDNYYATQVLKFSPGAQNKNIGRTILKSTPGGTGTEQCTVTVQNEFPKSLLDGDPFVILPEERELSIYTCNITVEFGISTSEGDKFSVEWFADGHPMANANTILTSMTLEVIRWSDDVIIVNEQWPGDVVWAPNANLFKYTSPPGSAIPANNGVTIRAVGLIDDIPEAFSRTLFNYS